MDESHELEQAADDFDALVERVARTHARVYLERDGKPVAVMISIDDLSNLESGLERIGLPLTREELAEAEADLAEGRFMNAEQLRAKYLRPGE